MIYEFTHISFNWRMIVGLSAVVSVVVSIVFVCFAIYVLSMWFGVRDPLWLFSLPVSSDPMLAQIGGVFGTANRMQLYLLGILLGVLLLSFLGVFVFLTAAIFLYNTLVAKLIGGFKIELRLREEMSVL
jgi:hypothetical protein